MRATEVGPLAKATRVECKLEIVQRQKDVRGEDTRQFMKEIGDFLLTEVKEIRKENPNPQYRVRTQSLSGNEVVARYLTKYPLYSSKYLDYQS